MAKKPKGEKQKKADLKQAGTLHLLLIIDRSGSMAGSEADVIGGTNKLLEDQRSAAGEASVRATIVLFDDVIELLCDDAPIEKAPGLSGVTFVPRGTTALLDAVGKSVARVSPRVGEDDRGLCVIFTDGQENASKDWTAPAVKTLLEKLQENNWTVLYLGADQDRWLVEQVTSSLGISFANTRAYGKAATAAQYQAVSVGTQSLLKSGVKTTKNFFEPEPEPTKAP